jgi:hypothetical protein
MDMTYVLLIITLFTLSLLPLKAAVIYLTFGVLISSYCMYIAIKHNHMLNKTNKNFLNNKTTLDKFLLFISFVVLYLPIFVYLFLEYIIFKSDKE